MSTPEERRDQASERAKKAASSAKIALSAADKPMYAAKKSESLRAGQEALDANEEVKRNLGTGDGMVGRTRKTIAARNKGQMDELNALVSMSKKR